RKRFMKKGLPAILVFAWAPIVWLLLSSLLTPVLMQTTSSFMLAQGVIVPLTVLFLLIFIRVFRFIGKNIYY
ncbi:MAG: hypothetical protein JW989_09030, partial [Chlorobiaceae bacterium]|nr:hypothetical protein [Chlorobiaceae bacterium]